MITFCQGTLFFNEWQNNLQFNVNCDEMNLKKRKGNKMSDQENVKSVSDEEFASKVLQADKPVLVDFWAPWCGPCRAIAPTLEAIADTYADRLIVTKVNVDNNAKTAGEYGIRSIPTLILFKNGNKLAQQVGGLSQAQLAAWLDEHIDAQ